MVRSYDPDVLKSKRSLLPEDLLGFDPEELVANRDNILLTNGDDVVLFEKQRHNVYSGHLLLTSRGKKAFEVAEDALKYVKGCSVYGLTPVDNKKALWFTRQLGFKRVDILSTPLGDMVLSMYEETKE